MPSYESQLGWAAGMLDGEGTIGLYKHNKRTNQVTLKVSIGNTYKPALEFLQQFFNGWGSLYPLTKYPGRKQVYAWCVSARQASEVVKKLAPYLIIKRAQAAVALEWARNIGAVGKRLTDDQKAGRQMLVVLIKGLNQTGDVCHS